MSIHLPTIFAHSFLDCALSKCVSPPTAIDTKKSFREFKIMKYSNWKEASKNNLNTDTYNKNVAAVIKFLHKPADKIECIQNIVNEPGLILISVAPITNNIQVFHHMAKIGGTLTNPMESLVGLKVFSVMPTLFSLIWIFSMCNRISSAQLGPP